MSDALPLPPRPNLEQYKKLARDLQNACKSPEPGAVREWANRWPESIARLLNLKAAPEIRLEQPARPCTLANAQFFIARAHGFTSWPKFAKHLAALAQADSPIAKFEAAVDAIVAGDTATLAKLLNENPHLARARSTRQHRSTLLRYVSANGVEDFRQKTPQNIVDIAKLLLSAGADVNAESEAYGGRSTTLGLTATSVHPETAGVQLPLLELLLDHGAVIDGPDPASAVNDCLHNGRGPAAEFFANRGAHLDLEGAAGVGRLETVKSFFDEAGNLKPPATPQQMKDGFAWACQFGHTRVVDFLLNHGIAVAAKLKQHGQTGLHWAAYGGHVDIVKVLLERGAPIDTKDDRFDGTPLAWALHSWGNRRESSEAGPYYETAALLVRSGATVDPEDQVKSASDPRMLAALRGEMPG